MLQNVPEALKYYKHAIDILAKINSSSKVMSQAVLLLPGLSEEGKVHLSLANLYKDLGEVSNANAHVSTAILKL